MGYFGYMNDNNNYVLQTEKSQGDGDEVKSKQFGARLPVCVQCSL